MSDRLKRLAELSILTALALIIFVVELQFPSITPIAGVKLGLANIITVYGAYRYKAGETASVLLVRILLGSLFGGNPSAIIYSLSGGALCLSGMLLLKKIIPENRLWVCSVLGAVLHNLGQTAAAYFVMGKAVFLYLPFLTVSGCVAGAITGMCAQLVLMRFRKNGKGGNPNAKTK